MLKALGLADDQNMLQVDLLRRGGGGLQRFACLLLCVTGLSKGSETEQKE